MIKVALCGTIGSGKSTVCQAFEQLGVAVYISDDRAKLLMTHSPELIAAIKGAFGEECYSNGQINRQYLASKVFSNTESRLTLNSIVHPAVCRDFVQWAECQHSDYVIVESAILFESGLDKVVDRVIAVVAPKHLCIERAMARDGSSEKQVEARMAVQMSAEQLVERADYVINNIDLQSLYSQVASIDRDLRL